MNKQKSHVSAVLNRHGIHDADAYLEQRGDVLVEKTREPEVFLRGSVHLMLDRKISRKKVQRNLDALKHL